MKKFGLSLARAASARLDAPMPTAAHALPVATSNLNMLAPSSRCMAFKCPDWSSTTTVTGLIFISRAFSSAFVMIWFAFARFSADILVLPPKTAVPACSINTRAYAVRLCRARGWSSAQAWRRCERPLAGHAGNRVPPARLRTSLCADGPARGLSQHRHAESDSRALQCGTGARRCIASPPAMPSVRRSSVRQPFRLRQRQDVADAAYRDVLAAVPKGLSHADAPVSDVAERRASTERET